MKVLVIPDVHLKPKIFDYANLLLIISAFADIIPFVRDGVTCPDANPQGRLQPSLFFFYALTS